MKISTVIIVLILFLLVAGIAAGIQKKKSEKEPTGPWPLYAKKILTQPEQVLYHRLVKALPNHDIFAQVQLSRALGVKKGFSFHEWNNRINRMSLDFVVCTKDSSVVTAIELDDSTHERKDRIDADNKKQKALDAAGIRLVRWNVKNLPDEITIIGILAKTAA